MQDVTDLARRCNVPNIGFPSPYQLIAAYVANSMALIGGLLLATSLHPKIGAFLLLAYLIPSTYFMHWQRVEVFRASTVDTPECGQPNIPAEMALVLKNVALAGACLCFLGESVAQEPIRSSRTDRKGSKVL